MPASGSAAASRSRAGRVREALPDREIAEMLRVRNRGFGGAWTNLVKNAVACTVSYELARRWHGNGFPVFAPITTLLAIQSTIFGTLGMAVQRVLGTVVGVAGATVFVNQVGLHAWSLTLAVFVGLVVARFLPLGMSAQIQVPLSVLLVMALGPVEPHYGVWRALDTALGGAVGVVAVLIWPPKVRLEPVEEAYASWTLALHDQLERVAESLQQPPRRMPIGERHAYLDTSRALHEPTTAARDALATAYEAARLNPLARRHRPRLAELERRQVQLERITLQVRGLSYVIDKIYDRERVTPRLKRETLADLLQQLAAVLYRSAHGSADLLSGRLRDGVDSALHDLTVIPGVRLPGMLDSVGILGRIEQMRQEITGAPVVLGFDQEAGDDEGELAEHAQDEEPDDAVPLEDLLERGQVHDAASGAGRAVDRSADEAR